MKKTQLLTILIVGLVVVPTTALAVVEGEPNISVTAPNNQVTAGEEVEFTVLLQNEGEVSTSSNPSLNGQVTTAKAVTAQLRPDADSRNQDPPITVETGKQAVGSIPDGQSIPVTFSITVDEDAEPGNYRVPVRITYSYTESIDPTTGDYDQESERRTVNVNLNVVDSARFEVNSVENDLSVGDSGTISVEMTNNGTEAARDTSVEVASQNGDLTFSQTGSASSYVGSWAPGETRTLTYDATVAPGASPRNYALTATVNYDDSDGVAQTSDPLSFGVTPRDEQSFSVENTQSTLRVGQEGVLSGEIVNNGETAARNAVVVFQTENPNVNPVETEYALGSIDAGERANFSFDTEISESATAGPRQFTLAVEYRNGDGESRTSDPLDVQASVGEALDEFTVDGVNTTFEAGESGEMTMTVTNNREETLTDISAKLFVDAPISASDDEAFIAQLEPGESETIVFGTSVGGSAIAKTYPVKLDFQYDTADGDTFISETYQIPVTVTEPTDDGGIPFAVIAGIIVFALLGVAGYLYSRNS